MNCRQSRIYGNKLSYKMCWCGHFTDHKVVITDKPRTEHYSSSRWIWVSVSGGNNPPLSTKISISYGRPWGCILELLIVKILIVIVKLCLTWHRALRTTSILLKGRNEKRNMNAVATAERKKKRKLGGRSEVDTSCDFLLVSAKIVSSSRLLV